jgi:hypothetical protein
MASLSNQLLLVQLPEYFVHFSPEDVQLQPVQFYSRIIYRECGSEMYVVSLIHDPEVIFRILSHLNLLEDEPQAGAGRSPPCRADHSPGELICEPFFDDLPAGELDEDLYRSIVNAAANN